MSKSFTIFVENYIWMGMDIKRVPNKGVELKFRKWISRVVEKLTFIELNVKEKKPISEDDYELWRALHDYVWFPGVYPIYAHENLYIKPDETAEQQGLFSQNGVINSAGIDIDSTSETLKGEDYDNL